MTNNITKSLELYAITDRSWLNGRTIAQVVEEAILGGVTMIQYREKSLKGQELLEEAVTVQKVCGRYDIPFIINDDPYLAKDINADGVHLGQGDMPINEARKLLGSDKIIGITAKTVEQALAAERDGASYLGSGAMFGSSTKTDAKKMTVDELRSITGSVSIPVVAIGGITADNVSTLDKTGIAGVAVVSAVFAGENITEDTKKLRSIVASLIG
ncbi:MAG: thiamine phosphate synthase [Lachnospiraceae bacterium]|nr:thiamine phosphate synthase [Lachnospiraceae bacterium]